MGAGPTGVTKSWYNLCTVLHMNKTKDVCLVCNEVFFEEDVEDKDGRVKCPNCGSEYIQPFGYKIYEEDEEQEDDSDGMVLA